MTTGTTTPEIVRYRDAVRAALVDLSAPDRDDLMEDVESHLTEVAAEDDGSLARLGSPAEYAAELRASAGLPAQSAPVRISFWARLSAALADSATGRGIERITSTRSWRSFRSFLPELRPGWWVLRGYVVVWVLAGVLGDATLGPVPRLGGSAVFGLLMTVLAMCASVQLGRCAQTRRSLRPWVVVATGVLLIATLGQLRAADDAARHVFWDGGSGPQQTGLVGVSNVYVFDSEGRPLTGVQLFDQDGNPLQVYDQVYLNGQPPAAVRRYVHVGPTGQEVHNVFPREPATSGIPRPRIVAPRVAPAPDPSTNPSPAASPSSAPGGGALTPSPTPTPR